jgi:hypothetical protein
MIDEFSDLDSEGVDPGMSLEEFGVRVSSSTRPEPINQESVGQDSSSQEPGARKMPRESLRTAIEHLRGELASGEPLSSEDRARLDRVLDEASQVIDPDVADPESEESLSDELREFVEHFEESHPKLAIIVGRVVDSLSQLGF